MGYGGGRREGKTIACRLGLWVCGGDVSCGEGDSRGDAHANTEEFRYGSDDGHLVLRIDEVEEGLVERR